MQIFYMYRDMRVVLRAPGVKLYVPVPQKVEMRVKQL